MWARLACPCSISIALVRGVESFGLVVSAKLHHQPAVAFRQQLEVLAVRSAFLLHMFVQAIVDALQRRRIEGVDLDHVVGGLVDVGIARA